MIPATFVGMALALGSLVVTMLLEGSSPLAVVLLPPTCARSAPGSGWPSARTGRRRPGR